MRITWKVRKKRKKRNLYENERQILFDEKFWNVLEPQLDGRQFPYYPSLVLPWHVSSYRGIFCTLLSFS